jgi:membrane associated rhomboid family serine protease
MFYFSGYASHEHIRAPYVTWTLLGVMFAVFPLHPSVDHFGFADILLLDPAHASLGERWAPLIARFITYLFVHQNWPHLLGNGVTLWVFGRTVEDATGHWRFAVLFFGAGIIAACFDASLTQHPHRELIGASGATAGVMAAFLLLHPKAWMLFGVGVLVFCMPASIAVAIWAMLNIYGAFDQSGDPSETVAYWGHIGGFLGGLALLPWMRLPGVALFQPARPDEHGDFTDFRLLEESVLTWLPRRFAVMDRARVLQPDGATMPRRLYWEHLLAAAAKAVLFIVVFATFNFVTQG